MSRVIASIIVLGGLSLLAGLWPLPAFQAAQLRDSAAAELAAPVPIDNPPTFSESRRHFYQSIADDPNIETAFWFRWVTTLALSVCCVLAGVLMFLRRRAWVFAVLVATTFYALRTGFVWPLYEIFLKGTGSFEQLASRLTVVGQSPQLLVTLAWFNLVVPAAQSVAIALAAWPFFAQRLHRKGSEDNAL